MMFETGYAQKKCLKLVVNLGGYSICRMVVAVMY
jgi:hypothetical protein